MNRFIYISRFAVVAIIVAATCLVGSAKKTRTTEAERDARKADYIFLEALDYQLRDKSDAYFSLIEEAHRLNPSDQFIDMQYGLKLLLESNGDSTIVVDALDHIAAYVESHPDDSYNALRYAAITGKLGMYDRSMPTWDRIYELNTDRIEVAAMYAEALINTGDSTNLRKAARIYDDIDRSEGISLPTSTTKMRIYAGLGDTAAVFDALHRLLESAPRSSQYATLAGNIYNQFGHPDSAAVYLDRAVEYDPTNGSAYYSRALFYESIGDSVSYDKEVFKALQLPDLELDAKLGILYEYVSKLYADTLQQPRIETMFQSLIDQYPHEAQVRNLYGDYLVTIERYGPAAEQISYAVDSDPTDPKRWQVLGSLYFTLKDYDRALASTEAGLKYHPDAVPLYTMSAAAKLQQKDYASARRFLDEALAATDSTNVEGLASIYTSIGDAYYTEGKPDSAFANYKRALEYNPDDMLTLNNCAYYLACEERDLDEALAMIERVIANDPESATSLDTYAWVLFKRKDYAKAREVIDGALANEEGQNGSADIQQHAGDIYFMNGQPDKALIFWKKALELEPDNELLQRKVKHKTFFYK